MMFFAPWLLGAALAQDTWPAGSTIDEAIAAQVTQEGLSSLGSLVGAVVPPGIEIPDQSQSGGTWCFNYAFSFTNGLVDLEIVDTTITPGHGVLDAEIDLLVSINDPSNKFGLDFEVACIPTSCGGYIEPFPVTVNLPIAMQIVTQSDGTRALDAIVGDIAIDQGLASEHIELDCFFDDIDDFFRDYLGFSYFDWMISLVEGELTSAISDVAPDLEEAIEDAFAAARISEDIDVLGNVLHIEAYPDDVNISPEGLELVLAGTSSADASNCLPLGADPGGSLMTASDIPAMGDAAGGLAILASDDFVNQILYTVWKGGVLCFDLADSGSLPVTLNTALLGLLAGDAFDEFFPEPAPLLMATKPQNPPVVEWEGPNDINITIEDLGLDILADVDDRVARLVGMYLDVELGVDLQFDGTTGAIDIVVDFDPEAIHVTIPFNELAPEASESIIEQFSAVFSSLVDPILGSALGNLSFAMGSMEGVGLTQLDVRPGGASGDWLEVAAELGPVSYGAEGCGGDGGCGGGCGDTGGGCSTTGFRSRTLLILFPFLLATFRRKR